MDKDFANFMAVIFLLIGSMTGTWLVSYKIGMNDANAEFRERLIKCNAAEYRIESKSGQRSFVIFAEEKASLKETE